ncbi:disulfide bond formation protein DsbA [Alcanivorax sp. N3-2A]|nr:disulfide bond formation protein DsbA [Alcanivorax sp. N3-2A]|tara:strand:- start:12144 stop:12776 length:633 start_codon:yes stop_codon:yes gene_type:complete
MLRTFMALLLGLGLMSTAMAADSNQKEYAAGTHYKVLETQGALEEPGKIEVREFFSYICPHCYHLEPTVTAWEKSKPDNVNFVRSPVTFLRNSEPLARAYYVADSLDLLPKTHRAVFDAIHKHREPLFTPTALADFFAKYGVDKEEFNQLYSSFGVSTQVRQSDALARDYQISGVPSFVVNGKYLVLRDHLESNEEMFDVINYLINKESK